MANNLYPITHLNVSTYEQLSADHLRRLCAERNLSYVLDEHTHKTLIAALRKFDEVEEARAARNKRSAAANVVVARERPNRTFELDGYTHVCGGTEHIVAVTRDGLCVTVGTDGSDSLFMGPVEPVVVNLGGDTDVVRVTSVSCGMYHSLFLLDDGRLCACGFNNSGQLMSTNSSLRVKSTMLRTLRLETLSAVVQVACGEYHSLALCENGETYAWGRGVEGQLGCGVTTSVRNPTQYEPSRVVLEDETLRVRWVFAGGRASGFVASRRTSDDCSESLLMCGGNLSTALGLGDMVDRHVPTLVALPQISTFRIVDASTSGRHTIVICDDGRVFSWGANLCGKTGLVGVSHRGRTKVKLPRLVEYLPEPMCGVSVELSHSLLRAKSGSVYGCGSNRNGQLHTLCGDDRKDHVETFRRISLDDLTRSFSSETATTYDRVVRLACEQELSALLFDSGRIITFGYNKTTHTQPHTSERFSVTLVESVWRDVRVWDCTRVPLSFFPLSFRLALRYAVLAWRSPKPNQVRVWRRARVGYLPLRVLQRVFSLASVSWAVP